MDRVKRIIYYLPTTLSTGKTPFNCNMINVTNFDERTASGDEEVSAEPEEQVATMEELSISELELTNISVNKKENIRIFKVV